MELDLREPLLRKIRIGELDPELREEVLQLALEVGHEATITTSSRADILFKLYRAEKAKEKKSRKRLKKAEKLILAISSLHLDASRQAAAAREEKKKPRIPSGVVDAVFPVNTAMRKAFESIGITDEKAMIAVVEVIGEEKAGDRIELVKMMKLEVELLKKVMPLRPAALMERDDDAFALSLDMVEARKEMIDSWANANSRMPPEEANYNKNPGILWEELHFIARILEAKPREEPWIKPPETGKKAEMQYRSKPMDPEDFIKVVKALGFAVIREAKHGTMMELDGGIMCVQKSHNKQEQLNGSTIKKKLTEAGVDLNEFEAARRGLGL